MLALFAFAGNSVLCKLALGEGAIDAAGFTSIRLLSGSVVLALILLLKASGGVTASKGSWKASSMLFLYAVTFSFAYVSLDTGTGALVLFGTVQITIIFAGLYTGNRLRSFEWIGVLIAFTGFVYLVLPGLSKPSLTGFVLMTISGIAWGFYTLAGKQSKHPLSDTAYNFLRTLPLVILLVIFSSQHTSMSSKGVLLAVLSGGLASGLGYILWYIALGGLSSVQAAAVQLLVPVLAAVGGIMLTDEALSWRLVLSSLMVLGGILVVILGKYYFAPRTQASR